MLLNLRSRGRLDVTQDFGTGSLDLWIVPVFEIIVINGPDLPMRLLLCTDFASLGFGRE